MKNSEIENRREFLSGEGLLRATAGAVAAGIVAQRAVAAPAARPGGGVPHVLVQLYLRGGADGLTLCVPVDEPNYHAKRVETRVYHPDDTGADPDKKADLIVPAIWNGGTLERTGFGLPPAFAPIKPLFTSGKLCFVHGVGCLGSTRSHFQQQDFSERGEHIGTTNKDGLGWIGRHLASTTPLGSGSLRGLGINSFQIKSYSGGDGVTPSADPEGFSFPGEASLRTQLAAMYALHGDPLKTSLMNDLEAIEKLNGPGGVAWGTTRTAYPSSDLGTQFRQAFEVIRDVPDIEVVTIDYDNIAGQRWDTHNDQGVFQGTMANLMADLSNTLTAFMTDVDTIARKVIVLVHTEFGRTLHENDGLGTDHGRGGLCMVLGDGVSGGRVITRGWEGLDDAVLDPPVTGDLPVSIDIRDVQSEIAEECLGNSTSNVFPDETYDYDSLGLIGP